MVLAPDPPVVLADEPEAALDIGRSAALMEHLRARGGGCCDGGRAA
jgi:ABC-type cobalamin/Fe3+-siderophores transport system ATPase subunit